MKNRELPPAIGLDEEPEPKQPEKPTLRARFSEWMKEGNPDYAKAKKAEPLLRGLKSDEDYLANLGWNEYAHEWSNPTHPSEQAEKVALDAIARVKEARARLKELGVEVPWEKSDEPGEKAA
jgi:hypothetical protein